MVAKANHYDAGAPMVNISQIDSRLVRVRVDELLRLLKAFPKDAYTGEVAAECVRGLARGFEAVPITISHCTFTTASR